MGEAIRVLLVDDHEMAREGLRRLLDMEPDIQVVGEASDGNQVIPRVQFLSPDVILMDVKMPTVSGIEVTRLIKRSGVAGKVIVLSFVDEYLAQAIEAGADGYLTKDVSRDELAKAIRRVHLGELVLGTSLMSNPEVGGHIVKRLQKIAWSDATGGTAQVPQGQRLGSIADTQLTPGTMAAVEEEKGRSRGFRWVGAPDGTITILFSDIQGSTAMTERIGDQRMGEVLQAHNAIVREQVATHGGFEIKSMGDGFMLAFTSGRQALDCAVAIQRALATHNAGLPGENIRVRIGLHTGEISREAEDFYGQNVMLASHIAEQARLGQILVSSLLKELTEGGDIQFEPHSELTWLDGTHRVYRVVWD